MTQPFKQTESGYTETAKTVTFSANAEYDVNMLDNPVRKKINAALIQANAHSYKRVPAL